MSGIEWRSPLTGEQMKLLRAAGEDYTIRNVCGPEHEPETQTEPETLHIDHAPDNFATESPVRAFTDWRAHGLYASGFGKDDI